MCVPHVQTLKLVGCQLTAVPETVQHMSQLRHLDLSANQQLSRLDGGSYLEHLRELNLSRCEFERCGPIPCASPKPSTSAGGTLCFGHPPTAGHT